jgi:hypothetical protein
MNFESLILMMGEEVTYTHNQMTKFLFNTDSLFITMVALQNKHCKFKSYVSNKTSTHIPSFPTSIGYSKQAWS